MWKSIELRGSKISEIWEAIQDSFEAVFVAHGAPEDAAMYFNSKKPGDDVTLYLSPGAVRIFDGEKWGAQVCAKPSFAGLLVGHDSAKLPDRT